MRLCIDGVLYLESKMDVQPWSGRCITVHVDVYLYSKSNDIDTVNIRPLDRVVCRQFLKPFGIDCFTKYHHSKNSCNIFQHTRVMVQINAGSIR